MVLYSEFYFHLNRAYFCVKWNITKYQNQVGLFSTFLTNVHWTALLPLSYMVYWLPRELYNDLFKTPWNCISLRSTVKLGEILLWIERAFFIFSFIYLECTIVISMNAIGISCETAGFCMKSKILIQIKCQPIMYSLAHENTARTA